MHGHSHTKDRSIELVVHFRFCPELQSNERVQRCEEPSSQRGLLRRMLRTQVTLPPQKYVVSHRKRTLCGRF